MSKVYVIADLHLGHKNITGLRPEFFDAESHDKHLIDTWNKIVTKHDTVYILGDVAFTKQGLEKVGLLKGRKVLIKGNHDTLKLKDYLKYFDDIHGMIEKKGFWLTHAPIHNRELRGRKNIHGHLHRKNVIKIDGSKVTPKDPDYINVCAEQVNYTPVLFDDIAGIKNIKNVKLSNNFDKKVIDKLREKWLEHNES